MRLTDRIYIVGSLQLGISGRWDSHVYLVKGTDGLVLIDSGGGTDGDRIFENIRNDGFDPQDIKALLLTHVHFDHSCGAAEIRERTGCKVYLSSRSKDLLERGTAEESGLNIAIEKGIYPDWFKFQNCTVDETVGDGDVIEAAGLKFRAVAVEGHSPDSVCYLLEIDERRDLFAGDVLFYGGVIGLINAHGSTMDGYRQDLAKLAGLDIDGFFPGHYLFTVNGGQRHIDAAIDACSKGMIPLTVGDLGTIF
jgi:glyoxylase-like metal-dependent hydrolase (beta-lactamase superfamily II)